MFVENRAHRRYAIEINVDLESEHNFYSGLTGDISEGGLFISTYMLPAIGERLEMELALPGVAEKLVVRGVVRWVRDLRVAVDGAPAGFGMEWCELPAVALAAIRQFADARDSIYFEAA